jgi:hypothetical protein
MPSRAVVVAVLAAAWLGAALLMSAVVAPAAFAVLPSRALAGSLVGRVLPVVFISGVVLGIATMLLLGVGRPAGGRTAGVAGAIWTLTCGVAQFIVAPRIEQIRRAIGGSVDALAAGDPQRVAFGRLHGASVALLGVAMLAAAAAGAVGAMGAREG